LSAANYENVHRSRTNLAIHILAVPIFDLIGLAMVVALARGRFTSAGLLALGLLISFGVQGIGHRLERNQPEPFRGPLDVVRRILLEQYYRFPRFVLTGAWLRAWRARHEDLS
jgi:2-hydroxy-palmitic acid dioxygenase Mpo1-like